MTTPRRLPLTAVITAVLLGGCAQDAAPLPSAPLTQQDVAESVAGIAEQLERALERAADDEGIVALQGFPQDSALSNPFFGYGVTLMSAKHPEAPGALRALADFDLPRGVYTFREQDGSATWMMDSESDDLTLNWSYDRDPETAAPDAAEASLTFDWDAQSPTTEVRSPSGESVEVPTGLNLTLLADGVRAADVDIATSYYSAPGCPAGILEPTSLSVGGTGSFLSLENVGYSVVETDTGETFQTQGKVTLLESGIFLDWNMDIDGELSRDEGCFSHSLLLEGGNVAVELGGLAGDVRSVALRFAFDNLLGGTGPSFSDGAVVINGDEGRAITFAGSLSDGDGNGIPGDDLTVTFADGSSSTLEELLLEWYPTAALRHHRGR
jgi:hypothetical protein